MNIYCDRGKDDLVVEEIYNDVITRDWRGCSVSCEALKNCILNYCLHSYCKKTSWWYNHVVDIVRNSTQPHDIVYKRVNRHINVGPNSWVFVIMNTPLRVGMLL